MLSGDHYKMKKMAKVPLTFTLLLMIVQFESAFSIRHTLRLSPPKPSFQTLPPDLWFVQKLDHFDPTNTIEWNQRYQVNDTYSNVKNGGPVFIMLGGEGAISAEWMVQGAWLDYAKKYHALCFQLEHRYYGQSRPTPNMSSRNLRFLSSEQALADLAYFIESMNIKYGLKNNNKWVAFGGSYPGSLAAWLRYKYPHLVHAAISSSGPLLAKADFKEYNQVVASSLGTFNNDCIASVRQATKHFDKLVQDPAGGKLISQKFKLCSDLDVTYKKDISTLADALAGNFADVVQYNKDNRFTKSALSNLTIDDLCTIMINRSLNEPIDRYAAVNKLVLQLSGSDCLNYTYAQQIEQLHNVTWDEEAAGRQWIYQTCTEFGFYQTSSSQGELFGSNVPLEYFVKQCSDIFGLEFTEDILNEGIKRSNIIYGELHLIATRVLYVHGSIDPWHALGITNTINKKSPAIYIKGTAHCANMYPPSNKDSIQLKNARVKISNTIGSWLSEDD